jgi:hypothetical protein
MKKHYILSTILLLFLFSNYCQASIKEAIEATCLIVGPFQEEVTTVTVNDEGKKEEKKEKVWKYSSGTGVVFHTNKNNIYILTAAHVLERAEKFYVTFFNTGLPSLGIKCEVLMKKYEKGTVKDVAILVVEKKYLEAIKYPIPKPIPLAKKNEEIKKDQKISSCGCVGIKWPNAWIGRTLQVGQTAFSFRPSPQRGRSGSGVFDENGTKILGLVIWTRPQYGTAVSINAIYKYIEDQKFTEE